MAKVEIGLVWPQVYHIIQDTARIYAPSVPQRQAHSSMAEILTMFGCELWDALKEAHPEQFGELLVDEYDAYLARKRIKENQ